MENIYKNLDLVDLKNEIWKDVLGYEGMYQVSSLGRIKSLLKKPKILKPWFGGNQQLLVTLSADGIKTKVYVSNIVGAMFLGFPDRTKNEVYIHLNKIKTDNRVTNLSIETKSHSKLLNYHLGVEKDWGIKTVGAKTQFVKKTIYIGKNKKGVLTEYTGDQLFEKYGTGVRAILRCIEGKESFKTAYNQTWSKKPI